MDSLLFGQIKLRMNINFQSILKTVIADAAIALLIIIIFGKALSFGLVWDDHLFIKEPYNTGIIQNGIQSFSQGYINVNSDNQPSVYYRPVTSFLFKLENNYFKGEAFGYHLVNILLHLINALILIRLCFLITASRQIAFIAAAFFAVFPLNIESVVWVSGRTDLLATCFILASLLFHLKKVVKNDSQESGLFWLTTLFFILACLSKESGYILLLLLPAAGCLFAKEKILYHFKHFKRTYISIFVASISLIMIRIIVIPQGFKGFWLYPDPLRWGYTAVATFFKYSVKLFYPFDQEPYIINNYIDSFLNLYFLFGLLLIIGAIFICFSYIKTKKEVSFAFLLIFISMLPAMNIMRIASPLDMGFTMADRFIYLPYCGVSLLIAWLLHSLLGTRQEDDQPKKNFFFIPKNKRLTLLCLILIILMGAVNFISSNKYKNDEIFYTTALRRNPESRLLRINLAVHYWESQEYVKAYEQINELKKYSPVEDADVLNIEGVLLYNLKKPADAIDKFSKAVSMSKHNQFLLYNFGILYLNLGLPGQAIEYLHSTIKDNPHFTESKIALALAYQKSGKKIEAAKIYEEMLSANINTPGILTNYGSLLFEMAEEDRGKKMLEQALATNPKDTVILYNYARCLVQYTDMLDEAHEAAEKIMQIEPTFPALYLLMAEIYAQKKEYNRALRWANAGLSMQNNDDEITDLLKIKIVEIYETMGIKR